MLQYKVIDDSQKVSKVLGTYLGISRCYGGQPPEGATRLAMVTLGGSVDLWWLQDTEAISHLRRYYIECHDHDFKDVAIQLFSKVL